MNFWDPIIREAPVFRPKFNLFTVEMMMDEEWLFVGNYPSEKLAQRKVESLERINGNLRVRIIAKVK